VPYTFCVIGEDQVVDLRLGGLLLAPPRGAQAWPRQHFPLGPAGRRIANAAAKAGRPQEVIRPHQMLVVLCSLLVLGYGASPWTPFPPGYREVSIALLGINLAWLVVSALIRQRRGVAELRARE
jgi:hypothetical protein